MKNLLRICLIFIFLFKISLVNNLAFANPGVLRNLNESSEKLHYSYISKSVSSELVSIGGTDASLSNLSLSAGVLTPAFATGIFSYTAAVPNATTSITLTPTTTDNTATVKVNGTAVASGSASAAINLNVGDNTITTVVTAQDGSATQTYTIIVTRAASADATLSNLALSSGTLNPVFASGTLSYSASVGNTTTSITITPTTSDNTASVTVNGNPVSSGSPSGVINLGVGDNFITIKTTAQDGTTKKTYTVTVTRPPSAVATLSGLVISAGTLSPAFASSTTTYSASVSNATTNIKVTPTTSDNTASVTVNGNSVSSGTASDAISLSVGNNTITTVVTAQDGTTIKSYTVTVTRTPSSIATLSNLALSSGTLNPVFTSGTLSYSASVINTTTSIKVTPTTSDNTASVTVNGNPVSSGSPSGAINLGVGDNFITIKTTAQDGTTKKTYTVTVTRPPSAVATLSGLVISAGTLSPAFASSTTTYSASVSNATTNIKVTPTTSDNTATVKVNGTAVASGSASGAISLSVGNNTITIVVTAQDGTTIKSYTVTVTKAPSAIATLSNLALSSGTLNPVFASGTLSYSAPVSNTTTSITITPTTSDNTASVKVNGSTVSSGSPSAAQNLIVGTNTITTEVIAQDGFTKKTYVVTITRKAPPPTIFVTGSISEFTSCNGSVSKSQSLTVNGNDLLGNININTPIGVEVSLSSLGNYSTNLSIPTSNGKINSTLIYIRLANNANGSIFGNISFSSNNATTQNIPLKGTVNPLPTKPTISTSGATTFCSGGSVVLTSSESSGNQWFLNGTAINGATATTYTVNASGDYKVQTTNSNGCVSAASAATTVTVNSLPSTPTISASGATTFCAGGSVVLTSSASSGNQWLLNGAAINGATATTYTASVSGDYKIQTTNSNGCVSASSAATTVKVNPLPATPTITAGSTTTFCSGGSVVLTSSASSGNQWLLNGAAINGATLATYTATASGDYKVQTTNSNGCVSAPSAATTVTVNPFPSTPIISAGSTTTFCSGGSVVLTSSASSGNQWLLNGTAINGATSATYTATASGDYKVQTTNSNGCVSASSAATTVKVNPLPATPTITAGSTTTFCTGGSVVLTSSASSGNQWLLNGTAINGATATTYTASTSGEYTVQTTNSNGCVSASSAATTVKVNPLPATPTITAGSTTTFCTGGSVVLTSSAPSGNQWLLNGAAINGATSATYTVTLSGDYKVQTTNSNGCVSAASAATTVTVNPLPPTPIISAGSTTTFCSGGSVVLTSSAPSGNQWLLNGAAINGATSATYTVTLSGDYKVQTTNSNGCVSAASAATTVTVNPLPPTPIISAGSTTTFCSGGSVVLTSSAPSGNQWLLNGAAINGATATTYTASTSGEYTVQTSNTGCLSATSSAKTVKINPLPPKPLFSWNGTYFIAGTSGQLQWILNGIPISGETSTIFKPQSTGNVTLKTTNIFGCTVVSDVYYLSATFTSSTDLNGNNARLFPNPSSNEVWLEFSKELSTPVYVRLYTDNGVLLQSFTTKQKKNKILLEKYAQGHYYINIGNGTEKVTLRITKGNN